MCYSTPHGFNPIEIAKLVERKIALATVSSEIPRKYYRFRPSRFYRGSATADATGCNLKCLYCWSWRANAKLLGAFYTPTEVALKLMEIARDYGYRVIRISGGEPTLAFHHITQVLDKLKEFLLHKNAVFVLETNGILLGHSKEFAEILSRYRRVVVRISIKGCSEEEFHRITGAKASFFSLQLNAVRNLLDHGVGVWPAITISFCSKESLAKLLPRLAECGESIVDKIELEYFKAYPSAVRRLCKNNIAPWISILVDKNRVAKGEEFRELCRGVSKEEDS
uniref:Radical SAM protein n=1 Tax=Ignisphaera aggregans TaxID=334771 RepID=A0A7J2TB16_9CREN